MKPNQNTRQLNRKEQRLLILLCFLCLCALVSWLFFSSEGILRYHSVKKELDIIQAENEELKEENRLLKEKFDKLTNDPKYFEEIARDKYKLLRKDEVVFEFR